MKKLIKIALFTIAVAAPLVTKPISASATGFQGPLYECTVQCTHQNGSITQYKQYSIPEMFEETLNMMEKACSMNHSTSYEGWCLSVG
jgi:hypothetical protein